MEKKILIERIDNSTPLEYNGNKKNPNALGHLSGPAANWKEPTRNGRRYPRELWENVINSEEYKEGMETLTIFGECDHPSEIENRVDSSIKQIAMVLTEMRIQDDGVVWGEFDILDTPQGRILDSIVKYGCKIGISSRGLGSEIQDPQTGGIMIDPSDFSFFGFDAVVTPAVKSARPNATESLNRSKLSESFKKEIENATSAAELDSIRKIAEVTNLPELASITEAIDNKLESYKTGEDISGKLEEDLGKISQENEDLRSELENLKSKTSANNIRFSKIKELLTKARQKIRDLNENLNQSNKRVNELQHRLERAGNQISKLQTEAYDSAVQVEELTRAYESKNSKCNDKIKSLNESLKSLRDELSELNSVNDEKDRKHAAISESMTRKHDNDISNLNEKHQREINRITTKHGNEIDKLNESHDAEISKLIEEYESKIAKLNESHATEVKSLQSDKSKLESQISKMSSEKILAEKSAKSNKASMNKKLTEANKAIGKLTESYIATRCAQEGISVESVMGLLNGSYTKEDADRKISEVSDRKRRLNKVPVAMRPVTATLEEDLNCLSDEDRQTWNILTNSFK